MSNPCAGVMRGRLFWLVATATIREGALKGWSLRLRETKETLENPGDPLLSPLKCLSIRDGSSLKVALQVDVHCFGFMNAIPVIMKPSVIESVQISLSIHQQGM